MKPRAQIWLDVPQGCAITATFTSGGAVEVTFGATSKDAQILLFEPDALARFVDLAGHLLAIPRLPVKAADDAWRSIAE